MRAAGFVFRQSNCDGPKQPRDGLLHSQAGSALADCECAV